MKTKTINAFYKVKEFREEYDSEEFYKAWHIVSWVFLIFGYALIIMNFILFADDPQVLFGLGYYMISVSLVNVFLMAINVVVLVGLIAREEGWYYYREYFWMSIGYIIVSLLLWKATTMG